MAQDITFAGEKLFATQAQLNQALDIDTFIFANVPGQDPTTAIDRNEGLPPVAQRVHTQAIQQKGKINDNIVVYSTVLESITGPFEFNWVGLYSSVHQTLIAVQHIPTVNKTTTVGGAAGNTLNRNFGIQYSGIAALTDITVDAQTWQLDFTARLAGMDILHQQLAREMNGDNWFTGINFQPFHYLSDTYVINSGFGYVYGLRVELKEHVYLTAESYPQNVYIDAWIDGDASSTWKPQHDIVMTEQSKSNYVDESGKQHFMLKIAVINGVDDIEDLRGLSKVEEKFDNLAAEGSKEIIGGKEVNRIVESSEYIERTNISPVMLEQFVSFFGGRGMLASESPNIATERYINSSNEVGSSVFSVDNTDNIMPGSRVVVYHSTVGLYESYFVSSVSENSIGITRGIKYPTEGGKCKVERLWYNQPHPGKFYMRMLAQKIALSPENEMMLPNAGRLYFSQFDSNPTNANDRAAGIGSGTIAYIDELNISQGSINKPVESMIGRALFISGSVNGFGADLPEFKTYGVTDAVISIALMSRNPNVDIEVRVIDTDGFVQTSITVEKSNLKNMAFYKYPVKLSGRTNEVKLQVVAVDGVTAQTSIIIDQIDVYEIRSANTRPVIDKTKPCIVVGAGDSWISGDSSDLQRESILTQLALELPLATIINSGVGGEKVNEIYERFDTDIAPYKPDFVIINTGTNDSYRPISAIFEPNSLDQFERYYNLLIGKIMAIGAKPIIIGMPALAEVDGERVNWELNDKAKTYNRFFYKRISRVSEYVKEVIEPEPEIVEFIPVLRINNTEAGITYNERVGKLTKNNRVVTFTIHIRLSSKGWASGTVTIDMPGFSNSGNVTPFETICINVVNARGMKAVGSISALGQMRLQIPSETGTIAATDENLADDSQIIVTGSYLTQS
ncbi:MULTISPECIES: phage tail-collar fiber domain-containing protein [unclassified Pseudoalteromonas]|uniref:phage tail-collar fiber domain-containing protein n=1 Tax=unclassified Pseudoalteromonas TaxID=194690 RepID=UPI001600D337|nr:MULTISPECIES: phage tail protein [unclassified Pseudoalteromonas]MBB1333858.1 phage tail protein [Pseudoalteromonas sp. SR41-6]MBB1459579.1 phage tail protein [Pseudoalteromonas sp. SG41-8]